MNNAIQRIICLTLAFLLVFNPMLATAGGIVVDSTAPSANKPGLSAAPNGVPMVDIAKPNSKGLSHNKFDQFSVGESGVIMNNSRKAGRTQLGGVVTNNPKLGKGPEARVILNEVTGSSRSRLEGYTEIFGYPADYILANPNGITVNGGGFINTPRATLTTGKPRFDMFGDLSALDVRQGDVLVDGLGLNVSNLDAFEIISRTARINADVHAVKLGISTGYGSHDVATGKFSDLPSDGSAAPTVALDSTALGGMYAERIILVGNEKGVGVNLEGITHATEDLVLTADGKIRITGSVSSDNGVRVASTADSVEISGLLAAAKVADVTAAQTLSLQSGTGAKALLYGEDVRLASESLRINDARVEAEKSLAVATRADVTNKGVLFSGGEAVLNVAGVVRNSGQMQAKDSLAVNGAAVENSGRMLSIGAIRIHSAGDVVNAGEVLSEKSTTIQTTANISNTGTIRTEGQAIISAGSLSNEGGSILAKDVMTLDAARHIANTGTIGADRDTIISAGSLGYEGGSILAQGDLDVAVTGDLSNSGMLYSGASSRIGAENLRNDPAGQVLALGSLSLDLGADLENLGVLNAGESLRVRSGGSLFNRGASILAQTGMELAAEGDIRNSGSIQSGGTGLFRSDGMLLNEGEILSVGEAVFEISNDLENTGTLHSGGGSYNLGGKLLNSGEILSSGDLGLFLAGDLFNSGKIAGDADVAFDIEGSLENAAGGLMLASAEALFDVSGDLRNSGRMESTGRGLLGVGGGLFNTDGNILSQTALDFDVLGSLENTGVMHSGDILTLTSSSLDNSGQILAQGDSALKVSGDLINTNFLFSGGEATFRVGGMLHNLRGQILSLGDMVLEGLGAGSRMLELKNDSSTIETLEGGMSIRAKVVRNSNLDFVLTPGTEVVSRKGGIYSFFGDNWDQAQDLYRMLPSSIAVSSTRNALIITPAELRVLGFGLDRNVVPRSELDVAIAAAEARFALHGGSPGEIATVSSLKSRVVSRGIYMVVQHYKDRSKVAAYIESITRDEATGQESGANIAAAVNLDIEADSFSNHVSRISTASGDISIIADSFENAGQDIYEHRTIEWARGHANEHNSPRLAKEGGGVEVVSTPIGHAYGTISAGGNVFISAEHVNNGILENTGVASSNTGKVSYPGSIGPQGGVIAPPRPEDLAHNIDDIGDIIGELPKDGLFSVNKTPGHRYLIETNPVLTSVALFYGSDYFLDQTGINLSRTHQQLLGDAFYESRLVREQVFALTGRRFLSDSVSGDSEQMLTLMDNAVAAREGLNLSVGIALSAEQVSALSSDIVWLETRVVDGHEVLVPVVYLCRASLDTIAQGGSVIIGRDVEIRTTGGTVNRGVIKASRDLSINADNIFNTFGTIQGDTLILAAVDSIFNTSGLIKGRDVSLDAGKDIISGTAKTTFAAEETLRRAFSNKGFGIVGRDGAPVFFGTTSTTRTTSETVGQRGSIEATGDLSMQAGRDIGVTGSDVKAGGDATLSAGRNVVLAAQNLESHSSGKTGKLKSSFDTQTSKAATFEAGGSVNISAGQDVTIQGSEVSAGANVNIGADRNISVISDVEGYEYRFKQKSSGGTFGTSRSELREASIMSNAPSTITAGGDVNMEAGKGGGGDLAVVGSQVRSVGDLSLKAAGDIQILPVQIENYVKVETKESGFMGTGSMKLDESQGLANVRSELNAGGKASIEAGDSVTLQSARITSGDETSITAENGQVDMLVTKDLFFERHVESDTGYFSWSSSDKGAQDETVQHTEISAKKLSITTANGVVVQYKETGNVRQDIEQLAQAPGLDWMGELLKRDDINWQAVQEVHNKWKHEDSGVGGPGVQLVALAVAVALTVTGVGTAFATWATGINTAAGTTLTATQVAMHSAVAAGFNSLVSQASVQLIANQGDVGEVLKVMTSSDTVRSLATVMLTAGLTNGLMKAAGMTSDPALLSQAEDMTEAMNILAEELQRAAIRGVVSAGVDTAINGGDLGQNLAYQMQAAGVAVLGSQGARAIGTAFKDQKIDTATKYIAHAALGGTMDLAMGGDGKSGALGAVAGELIADTYVNAWIGTKISQTEDYKKLSGDELRKELDKLDGEIAELRRRGVDIARLGAGMAAALTGGDIDIAAQTGGNAAEHNALPVVLIILAACEAVDGGIKIYNAYKLAEAIQDQDEAGIEYYGTEILIDTAVDAAPLGAVFTKLGMTKVGGIIMGLGAKVGDGAVGVASKSGQKLLGASIKWTEKDLAKVISKHGPDISGKGGTLKSRFFSGENIADLITSGTHQQAVKQVSGKNFERVFDVGRNIGIDVKTGKPTSIMTIVTQPSGRLVTAFPGTP